MTHPKELSNMPQHIGPNTWYYEERRGLRIIHNPKLNEYHHIDLPWKALAESLKRYRALQRADAKRKQKRAAKKAKAKP